MPVVGALVGAILLGLFYWLLWGRGMEYLAWRWQGTNNRARSARARVDAEEAQRLAPLRSVKDPRDAAVVLMIMVAELRGVMTPEQQAAIEKEMRDILGLEGETTARFLYARFAAQQAHVFRKSLDELARLLLDNLDAKERRELLEMLNRTGEVHGGPTREQQKSLDYATRMLGE